MITMSTSIGRRTGFLQVKFLSLRFSKDSSVKTQPFCIQNDYFFSTTTKHGEKNHHHHRNNRNNPYYNHNSQLDRGFSSSQGNYYAHKTNKNLPFGGDGCGICGDLGKSPQIGGKFSTNAQQMPDESKWNHKWSSLWNVHNDGELQANKTSEGYQLSQPNCSIINGKLGFNFLQNPSNESCVGANAGGQFDHPNGRIEPSQTANARDIEGQGCWWASVPIPPELYLTPTDSTTVGDGHHFAQNKKNLPNDFCGRGISQAKRKMGGGDYPLLRKLPNKFQTGCGDNVYTYYFSDDGEMIRQKKNVELYEIVLPNPSNGKSFGVGDVGGQGSWWSSVPIPAASQMDVGDGVGLQYREIQCTVEQLDDFLLENELEDALKILRELEDRKGIYLDLPRYLQLIQACGEEGTLQYGRDVYDNLIRSTTPIDVNTYNKILEMYFDCGSVADAYEIFQNKMTEHNLRSWDIMIRGLAKNGHGKDAINLFTQFKEEGRKPDGQMFMGVFLACSFLCDIDKGMLHFESMSKVYNIVPSMEHYVSVVNMLGSAGYLDEAMEFIEKMPFGPNIDVWETFMNLCRVHGDTELGNRCSEIINCLDPSRLTNKSKEGIVPGMTCDTKQEKREKNYAKSLSYLKYLRGKTTHHDNAKILAFLRVMSEHMKEAGYVPETRSVSLMIEEEEKESFFVLHGEKIGLALSILSSEPRSRVYFETPFLCANCHDSAKILSKFVGRDINISGLIYHAFRDGLCSCHDSGCKM